MLNIVLVAGSSRRDSQSAKVARFLQQRLIELDLAHLRPKKRARYLGEAAEVPV